MPTLERMATSYEMMWPFFLSTFSYHCFVTFYTVSLQEGKEKEFCETGKTGWQHGGYDFIKRK